MRSGGREVCPHEGAVDCVEKYSNNGDTDVRFRTRGCAQGRKKCAIGVMKQVKKYQEDLVDG